jgi:hypothetical protein
MRRRFSACLVLSMIMASSVAVAASEDEPSATGSFQPTGSLAEARGINTATLLPDGRVLVLGGGWDSPFAAELWDPTTGTFGPAGELERGRSNCTATLLADGRVLIVGGMDWIAAAAEDPPIFPDLPDEVISAEIWDPATGAFSPAGSLTEPRAGGHTATLLADGRVLIIGGWGDDELLASAELWDPATGSFGPAGSLDGPRSSHAATLLADGRVLVVGGHGIDDSLASAELWEAYPSSTIE